MITGDAATHLAQTLAAAAVVLSCCYGFGSAFLNRLPGVSLGLTRAEQRVFALASGSAIVSLAVFFLGLLGAIYDVAFILLAITGGVFWFRWGRASNAFTETIPDSRPWRLLSITVGVPFAWLYLGNLLAPEIGSDATAYHLGLVDQYYRDHQISPIVTSIYAFLSQGTEMLFLFAYSFARHDAPKWIHFAFFLATVISISQFGRRIGLPVAGYVAATLYGTASAVGMDAVTAYNDCALAFFQWILFYGLVVWTDRGGRGWPVLLGVLAGFCFAVKLTGAFAVAAAGLLFLYRCNKHRMTWRPVLLFSAVALLWIAPWPLKNAVVVGNPTAPFANRLFPNPYVTVHWEENYRDFFRLYRLEHERRGIQDYVELPLEVAVRGVRHGGLLGPVFLLAPAAMLLGWRRRWTPALLTAAVVAAVPFFSNSGTRFLVPALPFIAFSMALVVERFRDPARGALAAALVIGHAASVWPTVIPLWREGPSFWHLEDAPWRVVLGQEDRQDYLSRRLPGYVPARVLSTLVPAGSRALSFFALPEAYFPGEIVVSHNGAIGDQLAREAFTAFEADYYPSRVMRFSWAPRELSAVRIRQTVHDERNWWEVVELYPLDGDGVRIPTEGWTVDADLRPWDASKLIDGTPYTAWRSWRRLEPASIVLQAPSPTELSGLHLQAPWGQHFPQYQLVGVAPDGSEQVLEYGLEPQQVEVDVPAMKRRFHQALREQEIRAVVGNLDDGGHNLAVPHLDADPASWGLERVWSEGPLRIYRVLETVAR